MSFLCSRHDDVHSSAEERWGLNWKAGLGYPKRVSVLVRMGGEHEDLSTGGSGTSDRGVDATGGAEGHPRKLLHRFHVDSPVCVPVLRNRERTDRDRQTWDR